MQRIIGRDRGMSNAFFTPPFGFGMCKSRLRKSMCSIRTFFSAVGREPLSNVIRWNSRRIGFVSAVSSANQGVISAAPMPVLRRCSVFQSIAVTGLTGGRSRLVFRAWL
jgi:hypothetical protein